MISSQFKILEVWNETADIKSIKVEKDPFFEYKPGQYMMMELEVVDEENGSIRPLSLASSPTEGFLLFSTKISQTPFKKELNTRGKGYAINLKGPFGVFVLKEDAKEIMFLGGGIGITPFRDMIKYASDKMLPIKMTLLYSNRTANDICYKKEWEDWQNQNPNLKVVNTITDDPNWQGRKGRIDDKLIKEFCSDIDNTIFYICGPPGMVSGLSDILKTMDIPQQNIKIEKFAGY